MKKQICGTFDMNWKIIVIFFLASCSSTIEETSVSVYWWKNNVEITDEMLQFKKSNNIQKVYCKVADFRFNKSRKKIDIPLIHDKLSLGKKDFIPVLYIENDVFKHFTEDYIFKMFLETIDRLKHKNIISKLTHIQIDCDWTLRTRDRYFQFLNKLKSSCEVVGVTLRLHQVKYYKTTGVPDIDYGVLMIYNLSSVADFEVENSIYDYDLALSYLKDYLHVYPLKIKAALPAFSWAAHFHHKRLVNILNFVTYKELLENENLTQLNKNRFISTKAHFINAIPITKHDIIRYEEPDIESLKQLLNFLKHEVNQDKLELIIFSLNAPFLINNQNKYEEVLSALN